MTDDNEMQQVTAHRCFFTITLFDKMKIDEMLVEERQFEIVERDRVNDEQVC